MTDEKEKDGSLIFMIRQVLLANKFGEVDKTTDAIRRMLHKRWRMDPDKLDNQFRNTKPMETYVDRVKSQKKGRER